MTIREFITLLDEFGDHLEVVLVLPTDTGEQLMPVGEVWFNPQTGSVHIEPEGLGA